MLNREMLINKAKEAKNIKGNVYIVKVDNDIKIMISNASCSDDFLKDNNLDYNKNLIIGFTPDEILKDDHGVYNHWETNVKNIVEAINKDYVGYNLN